MKTAVSIVVTATLSFAMPVWACTPEEATIKREQLAEKVRSLTQQNPQKAKEINQELEDMHLETAAQDLPDKCQLIDQRLKELDAAAQKADG
ncbi:hypothetical protein TRP66_06760 [Pseudomonas sp. JDS28PS106]|uniref:hypothetical protein n=1 Tax=Pseudomonas sp. JDS28PS106 TaxID=2497235 RepID=UPI002FD04005